MFRKFIAAFVTILFAATIHTTAFANEFIPVDGDESRNPNDKDFKGFKAGDILRVDGFGAGPQIWDINDSFYRTAARQAARMDALRNLIEVLVDVTMAKDKQNPNVIMIQTSHTAKVFKLTEKKARVIDVKFFDDGVCEVTMEVVIPADWKN